jgi:hypothetical protein
MKEGQAYEILLNYDERACLAFALAALTRIQERHAHEVFKKLKDKFGWRGTVFTREDVEFHLERDLTDDEWERLKQTRPWRKMADFLAEKGWHVIDSALYDAKIEGPKDEEEEEDDG